MFKKCLDAVKSSIGISITDTENECVCKRRYCICETRYQNAKDSEELKCMYLIILFPFYFKILYIK